MESNNLHSYHIFYFPFKWELKENKGKSLKFSERINLDNVRIANDSPWINIPVPRTGDYLTELYNEKNFFYGFVHNVLYDEENEKNIIRHFERKEAYSNELKYEIKVVANKSDIYILNLKSLVLNLFSTGTGILIFYLENYDYPSFNDILRINQFGRRIFPPFLDVQSGIRGTKYAEMPDHLSITGLKGPSSRYFDDFNGYHSGSSTWDECQIIKALIEDLSPSLDVEPVIDDRMHVISWVGNDELAQAAKEDKLITEKQNDWYRFLFIDGGNDSTCQYEPMRVKLLKSHTYQRWQNYGSVYGISRYSMVFLSENNDFTKGVYLRIFRTMYARMVELSLIQRSSILKFADEVTHLSTLREKKAYLLAEQIGDFYKEYIRFVNQIYFREVTAQEQGIEIYDMIMEKMKIEKQVVDLDNEIGELHQYAMLIEEKEKTNNIIKLTYLGTIFLIPTFIIGYYGMNFIEPCCVVTKIPIYIGAVLAPAFTILSLRTKGLTRWVCLVIAAVSVLAALILPLI